MSLQSDLVTWANQPHIPKYLKKFLEIWQFMNIAIKFLSFLNVPKLVLKRYFWLWYLDRLQESIVEAAKLIGG